MYKTLAEHDRQLVWRSLDHNVTDMFLRLIPPRSDRILDVGCGRGYFSYAGAKAGNFKECFGCDPYPAYRMEEIAPYATVEFRQIESGRFPFPDNYFDFVFSMDVLEHVEEDVAHVSEYLRVCREDGTMLIGTPNVGRPMNRLRSMLGRMQFPRCLGLDDYGPIIHVREYAKHDLAQVILSASAGALALYDIAITPCWVGIPPFGIGDQRIVSIIEEYAHYLFAVFRKPYRKIVRRP